MNFTRRVAKLERSMVPRHLPRVVIRYEQPEVDTSSEPEEEIDENTHVIVVRYPQGLERRPAASGDST